MKFLFAVFFALCFAGSLFAQKQAEVIVTSTYLRQMPDGTSEKVKTLQKGDKVVLEKSKETNGWYYVSALEGTIKGWIRRDTISAPAKVESAAPPKNNSAKAIEKPAENTTKPVETKKPPEIVKNGGTKKPAEVEKIEPTPNPTPNVSANTTEKTAADAPPDSAGEPPIVEDNEVLKISTDEINLNVRVVNASNRPVKNLSQNQFKIYEDDILQPITALTTTEIPSISALVIDNSRSLRTQLSKVIEAGKIIVGTNRPTDQTAVVRFVGADKIEVVQDFTNGQMPLGNALDNMYVEGGQTAIIDAVYLAAKKLENYQKSSVKDDVRTRSLILVSDGDDRASKYNEQQLIRLLRDSNVQIYVIGFVGNLNAAPEAGDVSRQEKAKLFLTGLSEETGGKVFFPESIEELPKIAAEIADELKTQYTISYSPTNENHDGTFRKIKVVVADGQNSEKRTAISRTGRNAQK